LTFTLSVVLLAVAFLCTIWSATGKCPLWVPVLLLVLLEAVRIIPAR